MDLREKDFLLRKQMKKEYQAKYYQENKNKLDDYNKLWIKHNPDYKLKKRLYSQKHNQLPEVRERNQEYKRQYQIKNRQVIAIKKKLYRMANAEKLKIVNRKQNLIRYYKHKRILFNILGGPKCVRCGFTDIRALQFDHIDGDGRKERKNHSVEYLGKYTKHPEDARMKLQVLCANCNWIKRHERQENGYDK